MASVLTYHVVNGTVGYSSGLKDGMEVKTVEGGSVKISVVGGTVFVNSARVIQADVLVGNGVVHVIDKYVFSSLVLSYPIPSYDRPLSPSLFRSYKKSKL